MSILGLEQAKVMQRIRISLFFGQYLPVKTFSLRAVAVLMSRDRAAEQITGLSGHVRSPRFWLHSRPGPKATGCPGASINCAGRTETSRWGNSSGGARLETWKRAGARYPRALRLSAAHRRMNVAR